MKFVFLVISLASTGAVAAADGGVSCVEVEQRLATSQRMLTTCAESARSATATRDRCEAELQESKDRGLVATARVEACVNAKEQQCDEAAAFASSMLKGSVRSANSCVSPEAQQQLQTVLSGWSAVSKGLAQLDEFASGVSDTLPRMVGATEAERHFAHLLRGGAPLWNRRILIEALKLTAPNTWEHYRAQGTAAIDGFFDSHGPLPEAFMAEAHSEHPEPPGPAGPPLSAALKLTLSYLEFSDCDQASGPKECVRARQLVELLDTTGPLIIRRRIEEMWATPCGTLNADTVRAWLQDFPVSRKEKGQGPLGELSAAARSKLFLCYLADVDSAVSYRSWAAAHLPPPTALDARTLPLVDSFASFVKDGDAIDRCGRASKALQHLEVKRCGIDQAEVMRVISSWGTSAAVPDAPLELEVCQRVASLLWSGATITIADEFSHPPTPAEMVRVDPSQSDSAMARLRAQCDERQGTGPAFEQSLVALGAIAKGMGETITSSPWRLEAGGARPAELAKLRHAATYPAWVGHVLNQTSACEAAGLSLARCQACLETEAGSHYDCDVVSELRESWVRHRRLTVAGLIALGLASIALVWLNRLRRARRTFAGPMKTVREHLEGLDLVVTRSVWRLLLPSRHDMLRLELPATPAWERWGANAAAVLAPGTTALREADVNHAAAVALRDDARVVFLLHADSAVPDLGAVRATLDWAARGGTRAVQVLPLAISRLAWATRDEDLLDLVEATTLRGNPFEVRGPVRSSSARCRASLAGLSADRSAGGWWRSRPGRSSCSQYCHSRPRQRP